MDARVYLGKARVEVILAHPCDEIRPQILWCWRERYAPMAAILPTRGAFWRTFGRSLHRPLRQRHLRGFLCDISLGARRMRKSIGMSDGGDVGRRGVWVARRHDEAIVVVAVATVFSNKGGSCRHRAAAGAARTLRQIGRGEFLGSSLLVQRELAVLNVNRKPPSAARCQW